MLYPVELRAQRPFSPSESGVVRGGESVVFPSRRPIPFLKGAALLVVASEPHRFLAPLRGEEERRGWDSNPGAALWAAARFPAVLLRPLGHLSIVVVSSIPNNHPSGRRTERVGFEPTRVLRPYRFSGPAESTSSRTSPSLRIAELAVCPMLFQMFGAVRSLKRKGDTRYDLTLEEWRRGWDSNPRDPSSGPDRFQDDSRQPLGYLSGRGQSKKQALHDHAVGRLRMPEPVT